MITFKHFLNERAMHRGAYAKAIEKNKGALVGFEIEFRVDPTHSMHDDVVAPDQKSEPLSNFTTLAAFEQYFNVPDKVAAAVKEDFANWVTQKTDDVVESTWEEYIDDDEVESMGQAKAEALARKAALRYVDKTKLSFNAFMKSEHESPYGFVQDYMLTPKFGWASMDDDHSFVFTAERNKEQTAWWQIANKIGEAFGDKLGVKFHVRQQVGGPVTQWKIVPDTSITDGKELSDDMTGLGMEIVTPPLSVSEGLEKVEMICKLLDEMDLETNESTGIHVNLSVPDMAQKIDPLKLVLFMGDEYVLKMFDRLKNGYAVPQIQSVIDGIQLHGMVPPSGHELEDLARKALHNGKYRSVNLGKLKDGYLEFRAAGGANYHKKFDTIKDLVGRWVNAIDVAIDRNAERAEYVKKITKLLGRVPENKFTVDPREIPVTKFLGMIYPPAKRLSGQLDRETFVRVLVETGCWASDSSAPSFKQIKELRSMMKEQGITAEDLMQFAEEHDGEKMMLGAITKTNFEKFAKVFKLR